MPDQATFTMWLVAWLGVMAFVLWGQRKDGSGAGLVISYVLQLWVIHWLAAVIYAFPWYWTPDLPMYAGLEQSIFAIAGFAVGSTIIVPIVDWRRKTSDHELVRSVADSRWVHTCLLVGVVTYFFLEPMLHPIPTVGAIASAMSNLLLVALGIECWNGLQSTAGERRSFWRWVALCACLPFMTIVTRGFLGYGFTAMLTVFSFVASFYRPRWRIVAWSVVIGYLALSMYVTYMRDRREIRAVVWGQDSYSSRFSAMAKTFSEFEFLDLTNYDHLNRIDERLNQNALVGLAVLNLQASPDLFANGRTLKDAALSLVPRAFWPEKHTAAGSGDLVSEFTGVTFGKDTSVGIGHVMEWYVNFGTWGVFLGMILMGITIGWVDRMAAVHLYEGDWPGFILFWLPALSLLQVGGSLVETVSGAGAGLIVAVLVRAVGPRLVRRDQKLTPHLSLDHEVVP